MIDLTGKTVLITGGSRGIGAACVKYFIEANADVAFTYVERKDEAQKLLDTYSSKKIKAYKVELRNEEEVNKTVGEIESEFGKIDILVNNAGVWKEADADTMTLEQWNETIEINLTGTFIITKKVLPLMKKNNFGRIINISSTAGQRGEPQHSHYAASKGGIISYTKALAVELSGSGITANSVAPGWVISDMTTDVFADEEFVKKVKSEIPTGRIATAGDIAGPVLFLASELARQINGEIINVNGGSVLCG